MEEIKSIIDIYNQSNGSSIALLAGLIVLVFRGWAVMPNQLKVFVKTLMKKRRTTQLYANAERMKFVIREIEFGEQHKTQLFQKLLFLKIESICELSKKVDSDSKDV